MKQVLQFRAEWILPQLGLLWGILESKVADGGEEHLTAFCEQLEQKIRAEAHQARLYTDLFSQGREAQVELINNPEAFQQLMASHTFGVNRPSSEREEVHALSQVAERNIQEQELILLLIQGYLSRNWNQVVHSSLEVILLYETTLRSAHQLAVDYQTQATIKMEEKDWNGYSRKVASAQHHTQSVYIISRLLEYLNNILEFGEQQV